MVTQGEEEETLMSAHCGEEVNLAGCSQYLQDQSPWHHCSGASAHRSKGSWAVRLSDPLIR